MIWHVVLTTIQLSSADPSVPESVLQERILVSHSVSEVACAQDARLLGSIQSRIMGPGIEVRAKCVKLPEGSATVEPVIAMGWN